MARCTRQGNGAIQKLLGPSVIQASLMGRVHETLLITRLCFETEPRAACDPVDAGKETRLKAQDGSRAGRRTLPEKEEDGLGSAGFPGFSEPFPVQEGQYTRSTTGASLFLPAIHVSSVLHPNRFAIVGCADSPIQNYLIFIVGEITAVVPLLALDYDDRIAFVTVVVIIPAFHFVRILVLRTIERR